MSDDPVERHQIAFILNGAAVEATVDARTHLADFIRHALGRTGTHIGCEHGVCGACNVMVDGVSVRSCLMLAVQADGCDIDLQDEFVRRNALQCGYCTPGMLATATEMLQGPMLSRDAIRDGLSGNYCRCTGYQAIVDAIEAVMMRRAEAGS